MESIKRNEKAPLCISGENEHKEAKGNLIIPQSLEKKSDLKELKVKKLNFKLVSIDKSEKFAEFYKCINENISIAELLEIPPFLYQVMIALNGLESCESNNEQSFWFNSHEFKKNLYQGHTTSNSSINRIFCKLLDKVNLLTFENERIIHFEKQRGKKTKVTIYPKFRAFSESFLKVKSHACVKLYPKANKIFNNLRKSQRALIFFVEWLYELTRIIVSEHYKNKECLELNKKRIKSFLSYPSKHKLCFQEIQRDAIKTLKKSLITPELMNDLARFIVQQKCSHGCNLTEAYDKVCEKAIGKLSA